MNTVILSKTKNRQVYSLIFNIAIVIMEIIGLILSIQQHGLDLFQFYTQDSNLLAMVASAICVVYTALGLKNGTTALPEWVKSLKYMATCCLAITFVVTVCVLSPLAGPGAWKFMLFSGSMLYHHLLCPVAAFVSFVFLETDPVLSKKHIYYALAPTFLYAVITTTLNIARVMVGPYPFLMVYQQPWYISILWIFIILGTALLFSWVIYLANTAVSKRVKVK